MIWNFVILRERDRQTDRQTEIGIWPASEFLLKSWTPLSYLWSNQNYARWRCVNAAEDHPLKEYTPQIYKALNSTQAAAHRQQCTSLNGRAVEYGMIWPLISEQGLWKVYLPKLQRQAQTLHQPTALWANIEEFVMMRWWPQWPWPLTFAPQNQ